MQVCLFEMKNVKIYYFLFFFNFCCIVVVSGLDFGISNALAWDDNIAATGRLKRLLGGVFGSRCVNVIVSSAAFCCACCSIICLVMLHISPSPNNILMPSSKSWSCGVTILIILVAFVTFMYDPVVDPVAGLDIKFDTITGNEACSVRAVSIVSLGVSSNKLMYLVVYPTIM